MRVGTGTYGRQTKNGRANRSINHRDETAALKEKCMPTCPSVYIHYLGTVISLRKIPDILSARSPARRWEHAHQENTRLARADDFDLPSEFLKRKPCRQPI
jgi:hypothetical protein